MAKTGKNPSTTARPAAATRSKTPNAAAPAAPPKRKVASAPAEAAAPFRGKGATPPAKAARAAATGAPRRAPQKTKPRPTSEEISLRAYFISEHRQYHGLPGDPAGDWVEAERQLLAEWQ